MKTIDVKSLLIGILATALLFACADADKTSPSIVSEAKAATGKEDRGKWDNEQEWLSTTARNLSRLGLITEVPIGKNGVLDGNGKQLSADKITGGWEPFGYEGYYRKRIK